MRVFVGCISQQTCMNLLRSLAGVSDDCRLGVGKVKNRTVFPLAWSNPFYAHYIGCGKRRGQDRDVTPRSFPKTSAVINTVTSYIDGSMVYGSNVKMADNLRLLQGGLMRTLPVFKDLGLSNMLPLKLDHPDDGCIRTDKDIYCFLAGDSRGNEQIVLTVLQTMLVRQHNILATQLSNINPHWDDEKLYQVSVSHIYCTVPERERVHHIYDHPFRVAP
uniref:Uncharacterized protein n=1 Tax=Timema douglasi TaxID=61478 RepID=A0A7R8VLF0_TIMDO|nr:unnamed protein product [Timema douglasi]